MKLMSFTTPADAGTGRSSFGVVHDERVVDLGSRLDGADDLSDVLTQGRLDEVRQLASATEPTWELDQVTCERTIPWPGKIFCIGVNYGGRNAEYQDASTEPQRPSVFVRFPGSLVGHDQPLVRPPESPQLDYEGEIVAVMGTGGRRIAEADALGHVAGLTLGNEGTIRDWVRHAKFNVTQGKNWDASGSLGPWMVTADELDDLTGFEQLHLTTRVNGELRQDDTPATMAFSLPFQIAYLSTFCTLEPGDIIFTGTPTGAGARIDPPRFLEPGDIVEVTVPGIGTLRNGIVDE